MRKRREKGLTLKDIRMCAANGLAVLSIDRDLLEDLMIFERSPIGEYLSLRGFVVHKGGASFLRIGLLAGAVLKLENLDSRVAASIHGEPVVVEGFKSGKRSLVVERVSIRTIVKTKPYADYRYLKERALNGVETVTPEDLAVLCLVSSPKLLGLGAGGARQAVLGNHRSYLDKRLRRLTMSIPLIWKFGRVTSDRIKVVEKAISRYSEVSADVDGDPSKIVEMQSVDYPTIVLRAPRESIVDLDAVDLTLWFKGVRPRVTPDKMRELLSYASSRLHTWVLREGLDPRMRMFSVDYRARPSTALRLAMAMCRVRGCEDPSTFVDEALNLMEKAFDALLSEIAHRPTLVVKLRGLEKAVLRVLERYEPKGADPHMVAKELGLENVRSVELVLERLRSKGLVYCPKPGVYRVTPCSA